MRKLTIFLMAVLVTVGLTGPLFAGGRNESDDSVKSAKTAHEDLKIAVLLPSSPTDGGWGQVGAAGINNAADKYGFMPVIVEAATADLMKREAEALAQEGFHIIFGHGGQYAMPFSEISGDYPDTYFITAGGSIVTENQLTAEYVLERLTYIQGVMAAKLTKTGKIGGIVGGGYPSYTKTSRAFEMGIKSVDPSIEFLFGITQNSADMSEGYELTLSQINAGADIVWSNANQATQGSVKAARETDTYIFGTIMDIQQEAPEQTIATATAEYMLLYSIVIEQYLNDNLRGNILIGVESGGISWVWNDRIRKELPEEVTALYDELLPKIQSGEIYVPRENEGW